VIASKSKSKIYDLGSLCHWFFNNWEGALNRNKSEDLPLYLMDLQPAGYGLYNQQIRVFWHFIGTNF
jgi:hypothetical protein